MFHYPSYRHQQIVTLLHPLQQNMVDVSAEFSILVADFEETFAAVTALTVLVYTEFTFATPQWRTRFKRKMNDVDIAAISKAVNSLLNFEKIKYFGDEDHLWSYIHAYYSCAHFLKERRLLIRF